MGNGRTIAERDLLFTAGFKAATEADGATSMDGAGQENPVPDSRNPLSIPLRDPQRPRANPPVEDVGDRPSPTEWR